MTLEFCNPLQFNLSLQYMVMWYTVRLLFSRLRLYEYRSFNRNIWLVSPELIIKSGRHFLTCERTIQAMCEVSRSLIFASARVVVIDGYFIISVLVILGVNAQKLRVQWHESYGVIYQLFIKFHNWVCYSLFGSSSWKIDMIYLRSQISCEIKRLYRGTFYQSHFLMCYLISIRVTEWKHRRQFTTPGKPKLSFQQLLTVQHTSRKT